MTTIDCSTGSARASATSVRRFRDEATALRRTLAELDHIEREASQRESKAARAAISELEADLAVAEAEAQAERTKSTAELDAAMSAVISLWRARVNELRVQAHLAEMNARDALVAAEKEATTAIELLRSDFEALLEHLHEIAFSTLEDVRAGLTPG